ncbi:MAG: hypothetical protein ACK559_37525, partial [bacterium]
MPPHRGHFLQGVARLDRRRLRHAQPPAHRRPCLGGVAPPRRRLTLADDRLDAEAAFAGFERLAGGLAEEFGKRRVGPCLQEPSPEGVALLLHQRVEDGGRVGRRRRG